MNAVDTNVLIYAREPRDSVKQQKARARTSDLTEGALLWQVACEFIAASRKLTAVGYTQAQVWGELEQLRVLWKLIVPSEKLINTLIKRYYPYPVDSAIARLVPYCDTLLSRNASSPPIANVSILDLHRDKRLQYPQA